MDNKHRSLLILLTATLVISGCAALLPRTTAVTKSPWKSYKDVVNSYEQVIPEKSTVNEIRKLGFDIYSTPNLKILSYVDIATATQMLKKEELGKGMVACLRAQHLCNGYVFEPQVAKSKRYGNFFLDVFKFRRQTETLGWKFKATFLVVDSVVLDKFWSGEPLVDQQKLEVNPLGPFQDFGTAIVGPVLD